MLLPANNPHAVANKSVTAIAHPNIALVKYWGKLETTLNLPATHSLSITLDKLETRTSVIFDPDLQQDQIKIAGHIAGTDFSARIRNCLDQLREQTASKLFAQVDTTNNFPTAAGLASSASGFAALITAANGALGAPLELRDLALLARQASGSAGRSLFGGYAIQHRGSKDDGSDSFAEQLYPAEHWPLEVVVAITNTARKTTSSSAGMLHTATSSPYWDNWMAQSDPDIAIAKAAIKTGDFTALAEISEASCMAMHAVMQAARPGLIYWNAATVDLIHLVRSMRASGIAVFFTIDAGPQLKAVCLPKDAAAVAAQLGSTPGVVETIHCQLGAGAHIVN